MVPTSLERGSSRPKAALTSSRLSYLPAALIAAIPLILGTFILVRRFDPRAWPRGGFDMTTPLGHWEFAGFLAVYAIEALVLLVTTSGLIHWGMRTWTPGLAWLSPAPVIAAYIVYITVKFRIMRSLKDGLDFAMLRSLGGGSVVAALSFVRDQCFRSYR